MVQSFARIWVLDPGRRHARHLCAYGDAAALRHHRAAAGPVRAGALRTWPQGNDGGGGAPRRRVARRRFALSRAVRVFSASMSFSARIKTPCVRLIGWACMLL